MSKPTYEELEAQVKQLAAANQQLRDENLKSTSALYDVVAENVAMKSAFDKPQAYLSWHAIPPTWEDPLPCGEYLNVHDTDGHKNSDGTDCWPVYAKPEIETPATDAFLASLRAEGEANAIPEGYVLMPKQIHLDADSVECICSQGGDGGYNYGDFTDVVLWVGEVKDDDGSKTYGLNVSSADYPEEGSINLCEFSAQLRSQSEQVKGGDL